MCGIVGLVYKDASRRCEPEIVTAMRDLTCYRGPDDAGLHIDESVGLGHRRLSIIDLSGGHQPMSDSRKKLWLVFNGEIYNYRQLREELIAKGYTFQSNSDTEVILNLYLDVGEDCASKMNGMFAFAVWDTDQRSLFLARDRMGVKPLYYADTPGAFVFASEIKSLFASGAIQPECREDALAEYLLFRQVAGPDTLFKGVKSLAPGCTMTLRNGHCRTVTYWSPNPQTDGASMTFDAAKEELEALLEDSVRLRLISDVPVGTFCSGGVDSSLVTAIAAKVKDDSVNTFSVGFNEEEYDETSYARMVSRSCNTVHHELRIDNVRYSDLFSRMVWHNDEPLNFANSVQIFALSEVAKHHVTVVLTGEGADELFAGYPRYRIPDLVRSYRLIPAVMRRLLGDLTGDHRFRKLERYVAATPNDALLYNSSYLPLEVMRHLYPAVNGFSLDYRHQRLNGNAALGLDTINRLTLLDQETFLVSILHRQDKMSMAAAIESRVPFMDYRIVEFANRLSSAYKIKGGSGKAVVKAVARKWLPAAVVDRRKSGFGVPLEQWFRAQVGMGERIRALADSPAASMFDRGVIRRAVTEHRSGAADHSELLWTVLNVCTWREAFRC